MSDSLQMENNCNGERVKSGHGALGGHGVVPTWRQGKPWIRRLKHRFNTQRGNASFYLESSNQLAIRLSYFVRLWEIF